jgi:amino acid permease
MTGMLVLLGACIYHQALKIKEINKHCKSGSNFSIMGSNISLKGQIALALLIINNSMIDLLSSYLVYIDLLHQ